MATPRRRKTHTPPDTRPPSARTLARDIERALARAGSRERARQEKRYLRSDLEHYGVSVPQIRSLTRSSAAPANLTRGTLLETVDLLWNRPIHELRMAAVELLVDAVAQLEAADLVRVEKLIRSAKTWALVDPLAATVAGGLFERFPALRPNLDRWVRDPDFWIRRSALLTFLAPLRRGQGDFARFGRCADALLDEKEFFIRKAIGWVLRETSKRRPRLVYDWLEPRASRASGVTLREALRYLPAAQQKRLRATAASLRSRRGTTRSAG